MYTPLPLDSMLKVGDKAPAFTLPDQQGKQHTLKDQLDSWVFAVLLPERHDSWLHEAGLRSA